MKEVHKIVYDKTYDLNIIDWFEAFIKKDLTKPQKTDNLFHHSHLSLNISLTSVNCNLGHGDWGYKTKILRINNGLVHGTPHTLLYKD